MNNWKISKKLSVAFFLINAAYILGIIALLFSYWLANNRLNNMNDNAVSPQIVVEEVRDAVQSERIAAGKLIMINSDTAEYDEAMQILQTEHDDALAAVNKYSDIATEAADKEQAQKIKTYYVNEYSTYINELEDLAQKNENNAAVAHIASSADIESEMGKLLDEAGTLYSEKLDYYIYDAWFGFVRLLVISGVVIVLLTIFVVIIVNKSNKEISRRIENLTEKADRLAAGDLNIELNRDSADEIGQLTDAFHEMSDGIKEQSRVLTEVANGNLNVDIQVRSEADTMNIAIQKMIDSLNDMLRQISTSTGQVSAGAKQIADGAQFIAQGASQQDFAVEQLSNSIDQVSSNTKENTSMAEKAASLMNAVDNDAVKGSDQMGRMAQAVEDIRDANQNISKVIKVIDDIAFQTNILSLNAAVEAERAGQHGKGFAVVAEEVRNLASRSAAAAKETSSMIEDSIQKAIMGDQIAEETVTSFERIVSGIEESTQLLNNIAGMSQKQDSAANDITENIGRVASIVQQNSATSEESAASSEELSSQAEFLESLTSQFKLKNGR